MTTPPAADVREALISALHRARRTGLGGMTEREAQEHMADAILSASDIEVRSRGTATDAEVEAALLAYQQRMTGSIREQMRAALEAAREAHPAPPGVLPATS